MTKQIFPAEYRSLIHISKFIETEGKNSGLNENDLYSVKLAVDEACTNIIEHAYRETGEGEISCECVSDSDSFEIILNDTGKKFDPEKVKKPNVGVALDKLQNRGAGLFLIKKLMDDVNFEFDDIAGTTLRLKKNLGN